jgi:hypothetical protein
MELVAMLGTAVLAVAIVIVTLQPISQAAGNPLDWIVPTFGNEVAAGEVRKRWQKREVDRAAGHEEVLREP